MKDLEKRDDIETTLSVDLVTAKNNKKYNISISTKKTFSDSDSDSYKISHDLICQYDGAIRLGTLKNFQLGCCETSHCDDFKKIYIQVNAEVIKAGDEDNKFDVTRLKCIPVQQTSPLHTSYNTGNSFPSKTALLDGFP